MGALPKRVDWRTVRSALLTAKPDWQPSRNNEPNPDWDFAVGLIDAYDTTTDRRCSHCGEDVPWHELYRCFDCSAYLCDDCVGTHEIGKRLAPPMVRRLLAEARARNDGMTHGLPLEDRSLLCELADLVEEALRKGAFE